MQPHAFDTQLVIEQAYFTLLNTSSGAIGVPAENIAGWKVFVSFTFSYPWKHGSSVGTFGFRAECNIIDSN